MNADLAISTITGQVRHESQLTCVRHNFWNGLGAGFLYGDVIAIIALFYGATDLQVMLLFAAIHMALPVALLAPKFLSGTDCTVVWRSMWALRTLIVPGYFLLPLIPEAGRGWVIVGIFTLFCTLRAVGVSASLPAMQTVSTDDDRQALFSRNMQAFAFACMLVTISAYLVLEGGVFASELVRYQVLIGMGFAFSLVSTLYLFRLPRTGCLESLGGREILQTLIQVLRDRACRQVVMLALVNTFILVLCGQVIPFMKKGMAVSSGAVVVLCSCGLLGAGAAMHVLKRVGRRWSSHGELVAVYAAVAASMVFLALSSRFAPTGEILCFVPAIVLLYAGKCAAVAIISSLQADSLPTGKRYAYSAIFQISSAIAAAFAVGFVALLRKQWDLSGISLHTTVFWGCALSSIGLCLFCLRLHPQSEGG